MSEYNVYPAIDEDDNFHPDVLAKIVGGVAADAALPTSEIHHVVSGLVETAVADGLAGVEVSTGSTLYVSSINGDDNNSGLVSYKPKKTFESAYQTIGAGKGVIVLAPDETFPIYKPYVIDVNRHTIRGERSVIETAEAGQGIAVFTVVGSLMPAQFQSWEIMTGIQLICTRSSVATPRHQIGLYFDNGVYGASRGPSHMTMSNFIIRGYKVGIEIGDQTYCLTFNNFQIGHCDLVFSCPAGVDNSGERITFSGGTLFNSSRLVDVRHGTCELNFINVSFDAFTEQLAYIDGSKVSLYGCHVEFDMFNTTTVPIHVKGASGSFNMYGGQIKGRMPDELTTIDFVITNEAAWRGGSIFRDVMMHNLFLVNKSFANGPGLTQVVNENNYGGATRSPVDMGAAMNLLGDGGFDADSFVDDWFILSDENAPSSRRTTGTNIALTYSNSYSLSGGTSLRIGKTANTNSPASAALAVPMGRFVTPHAKFAIKNPFANSGTLYISFEACIMRYDGSPRPTRREQFGGLSTVDLSNAEPNEWRVIGMIAQNRMPAWATHLLIVFNMSNGSNGSSVYLDSFSAHQS